MPICPNTREIEDLNTGASLLRGCLKASMIRSIDGNILGKDGKPMKAYRQVKFGTEAEAFVEPVSKEDNVLPDRGWEDNEIHAMQDGNGDSNAQIVNKSSLSFAAVVQDQPAKRMVKIKELSNDEKVEGAAVAIPLSFFEVMTHQRPSKITNASVATFSECKNAGHRLKLPREPYTA
ncbi:hypothetical protein Tco_0900934 [Tanacetum coccineum]